MDAQAQGIGNISKPNSNSTVEFRVNTLKDLVYVIIPHFDKYPLVSKKRLDFFFFKQIVLLMLNKEHNTLEGLKKVVACRAHINLGLTAELKEVFPDIISAKKIENFNGIVPELSYDNLHPE